MTLSPRLLSAVLLLSGMLGLPATAAPPTPSAAAASSPAPSAEAADERPSASMRAQDGREAAATVLASINKLFELANREPRPDGPEADDFLDREMAPYFDFGYMAAFVAGPRWQDMASQQRDALAAQLESRILRGVAHRLLTPPGQQLRSVRPRPGKRESVDVVVGLDALRMGRPVPRPISTQPLVFRMYRTADGWKVFDILADGRSLIASYRASLDDAISMTKGR